MDQQHVRYFVEPEVGNTQKRVALGLYEECESQGVTVIDRNGRARLAPELYEPGKEIYDRLRKRQEDPEMRLRFYERRPGRAIREVRPRVKAGTDLLKKVRQIREAKGLPATIPF